MCSQYFDSLGIESRQIEAWHFCDNEKDANECADLTLEGIKRATTSSLAFFEHSKIPVPAKGDLDVITNWQGEAVCIIQTQSVSLVPFNQVTSEYAEIEGEGDKSLEYWKRVHWAYYQRELSSFGMSPTDDMLVVCQIFKVVFKS